MKLKKLIERILSVCLVAALALSLAACSSSGSSTTEASAEPTAAETQAPEADGADKQMPDGQEPGGQAQGGSSVEYTAATTFDSDASVSGESYSSTGDDENAVLVTGGSVTLDGVTVTRESASSTGGDNSSFYGVGAALLVTGGTLTVSGSSITTDAAGGAGVFAYGSGVAYVSDTEISTAQDTSGGIHVAGGGTLYATDVTAETQGNSSAAIRSDRGGGMIVAEGGSYTSNGTGSPAVYSTANISVKDAVLTATNSEAVCIEGLNSLYLYDCDLSGAMHDDSQNDTTWNVILYQSMSGDSEVGNSTFQMVGGTLTAENGGMFYTTNTESTFILQNVTLNYADDNLYLLRCTGNTNARGWGSTGSNGADCSFTAIEQTLEGDVIWDSISNLDFYLTEGSTLTGAWLETDDYGTGDGEANLYISEDSSWVVTGDSVLTALYNAGTISDPDGKSVTVKGEDGTVYVTGDSEYTVTVSSYSEEADLSGASAVTSFEDSQVNNGSSDMGSMPGGQDMPEGGMPSDGETPPDMSDGGEPPELPDGDGSGNPGGDGSNPGGETPPDKPDGDASGSPNGETPPAKPDSSN